MTEELLHAIDAYLLEEMSEAERIEFESKLATDPNLKQAVKEQQSLHSKVRMAYYKDYIKELEHEVSRSRTSVVPFRFPSILLGIAAVILILILVFSKQELHNPSEAGLVTSIDSVNTDEDSTRVAAPLPQTPEQPVNNQDDSVSRQPKVKEKEDFSDPIPSDREKNRKEVGNLQIVNPELLTMSLNNSRLLYEEIEIRRNSNTMGGSVPQNKDSIEQVTNYKYAFREIDSLIKAKQFNQGKKLIHLTMNTSNAPYYDQLQASLYRNIIDILQGKESWAVQDLAAMIQDLSKTPPAYGYPLYNAYWWKAIANLSLENYDQAESDLSYLIQTRSAWAGPAQELLQKLKTSGR